MNFLTNYSQHSYVIDNLQEIIVFEMCDSYLSREVMLIIQLGIKRKENQSVAYFDCYPFYLHQEQTTWMHNNRAHIFKFWLATNNGVLLKYQKGKPMLLIVLIGIYMDMQTDKLAATTLRLTNIRRHPNWEENDFAYESELPGEVLIDWTVGSQFEPTASESKIDHYPCARHLVHHL